MREEWRATTWGAECDLKYGKALSGYRSDGGTVQVFGTNGPIGWTDSQLSAGPRPIVGRKGAYRGVHMARGPFWVIDTAYWLEPGADMDPFWAYYALGGVDINGMDSGSAIPSLTRDHFRALPLDLPPLDEQRRIAGILRDVDELIAANEFIRTRTETLGRALTCAYASEGFDMLDGGTSESWEFITLGKAARTVESGKRPVGGVAGISSGVPSIGAESIKGLGVFDFAKTKFVPRVFADAMKRGRLESRDVVVYKDGGKPGEFRPQVGMFGDGFPFEEMTINEHVYRVRAAQPLTNPYLYFWLSSQRLLDEMAMLGTGAAIPGLNSTAFKSLPVAVPPADVRERLFPVLEDLVGVALGAAREARDLTIARDELLPLLLSGCVSVREVAA